MKPRALDLFCGAGGATKGLQMAGFHVTGIDIKPQPRYCGDAFIQADALRPPVRLADFDLVWASPPCQGYSRARNNGSGSWAPRLIPEVRALLQAAGLYVIENVPGAPLRSPALLCGASFGLGASGMDLARHRLFETNFALLFPQCQHRRGKTMGVYGNGTNQWHRDLIGRNLLESEKREAMGINWATRKGLAEAIPPAYSKHIGEYALMALESASKKEDAGT